MALKMRDSGVEWIGEVPEGWEITPLKKCFEKTFSGIWGTDAGVGEETVTCYRIADFNYAEGIVSTNKLTKRSYKCEELEDKLVRKGDLLLEKSGGGDLNPVGRAVLVNHDDKATCSNFIQALRCNAECDERFVCYMLQTSYSRGVNGLYYNQTIGIQNLQVGKYLSIRLPMPHLPEQRRIADYLDEKCAAIDGAIGELKRGIEDCKAWKKAIIFEAVTGKANVLAASACAIRRRNCYGGQVATADKKNAKVAKRPMRDSGIPWIGEIPEGWEVRRLKGVLARPLQYGASESGIGYNEALPRYIRITDITLDGKLKDEGALSLTEEAASDYILRDQDILLARSGATVGKAFLYEKQMGRAAFAGYLIRATVDVAKALPRFVYYTTLGCGYDDWRSSIAVSATIQNIGADKYNNYSLPIPPMKEQQAIADYLDEKCAAIDTLVAEKEKLITDLEAYKKSLIFELVTGKREVA